MESAMTECQKMPSTEGAAERQSDDVNTSLLISGVRQHERIEQAETMTLADQSLTQTAEVTHHEWEERNRALHGKLRQAEAALRESQAQLDLERADAQLLQDVSA